MIELDSPDPAAYAAAIQKRANLLSNWVRTRENATVSVAPVIVEIISRMEADLEALRAAVTPHVRDDNIDRTLQYIDLELGR